MLRLDRVIKPWRESAALNDHINLYGFWNETTFLTKSGDVGMILSISGVDYESLDRSEQEYAVKRLEAALKAFGPGFHVYQYLFKSNRPDIPFATYDEPVVNAAIDQRRRFFEAKRDHLYQVEIFYCILLEGARSKTGVATAIARLLHDPKGAIAELKSQFTNDSIKTLLRRHIECDLQRLDQHVQAFARQLADFVQVEILDQQGQFSVFRRLLNYDDSRVAGRPQSTQFLDYQVVNSDIEAERNHLRVGNHIVRVLTMKEAITETRPLVLDALLKIPANFYVVTEWTPLATDKARREVNKRRRHFNMSKTGFVSQMGNGATQTNPRDVLVDESKQADIEDLGDCLRALGDGQSLGDFSLTIVLYGSSRTELDQLVAQFTGVFTNADGNLFVESYNQLNAYFATVPGNYALNIRKLYLLNTNYADLSFLFTILPGEKTNTHLGTEYLAALETDNSTPYFLNLHNGEVAHTGLRVSELAGLRWNDIGLNSITVDERFCRGDWGAPKSEASNATIGVNRCVTDRIFRLKQLTVEVKAGRAVRKYKVVKSDGPDDLVFQGVRSGGPLRDNNILVRFIKPAARTLELPWVNWRSLRTSHATWLKMAGADVKDAQAQMRHSRSSTTLDIYQQFVPESQQRVVEKLSGLVN